MSRCSNGIVDGVVNGLALGFVFGAGLSFFRCCNGRALKPMVNEGMRWASSGAVFFGILGAIRHCMVEQKGQLIIIADCSKIKRNSAEAVTTPEPSLPETVSASHVPSVLVKRHMKSQGPCAYDTKQ